MPRLSILLTLPSHFAYLHISSTAGGALRSRQIIPRHRYCHSLARFSGQSGPHSRVSSNSRQNRHISIDALTSIPSSETGVDVRPLRQASRRLRWGSTSLGWRWSANSRATRALNSHVIRSRRLIRNTASVLCRWHGAAGVSRGGKGRTGIQSGQTYEMLCLFS